jgi:SRSO17 transposase
MDAKRLHRLQGDLTRYLDDVLPDLGRQGRRTWAELYLRGLLLDGRRKSAGAMAERLQRIDQGQQDYEQGLQQFLSKSPWDERRVRDQFAQYLAGVLEAEGLLPRPAGGASASEAGDRRHLSLRSGRTATG